VLCEPLRNPRLVAWEVAGLDRLTGGRFELGLGAGRPGAEHDAERLGVPWPSARERVDRLVASVAEIRRLLGGAEQGFPAAAQHVPLMIAASGPRLLSIAGRRADIVALGWPPATTEDAARRVIDRVRAAAGARDVELATGLIAVGDEQHPWLQRMGVDAAQLAAAGAVSVVTGTPREMADALLRRRDRLGLSYVTVPVQSADAFAPVVELLAGA
jgi:alkanesulfonate monooxygenase SsuD/methylene tetrahydromethanopterin reductase-like flavin-dependent oxidoreductase (luciferase family)